MSFTSIKSFIIALFCCHLTCAEIIKLSNDETCELKIDDNIHLLPLNHSVISVNNPCIIYKCVNDSQIITTTIECKTTCETDRVYRKISKDQCCGRCIEKFCLDFDGRKFKTGDTWKSPNNCTINECIDDGREFRVSSYQKTCPTLHNCPQSSIEVRDCCPYCNYRAESSHHNEVILTNRDSYRSHECHRECKVGESKTCFYEFIVESFETMSKACYNCPSNRSDCFRPHCVTGDGMKRTITTVNRMIPGPSIEVCFNDTIVVDVRNHLMNEGTTIHWHGIHQRKSPFMDGVPGMSQCPIHPGQTFRYKFTAENAGTHLWHSHLGMQRGDGAFGALIVRKAVEMHENLYDFDMTEHIMITNDWTHVTGVSKFTAHHHGTGDNKPSNILINGKGKYFGNLTKVKEVVATSTEKQEEEEIITTEIFTTVQETTEDDLIMSTEKFNVVVEPVQLVRVKRGLVPPNQHAPFIPYETFSVVKGNRYRFRHINAGFLNCPVQISVDNHTLTAIATDGNDIVPQEVTFLVTYAGERWDFIINANQKIGNYFIRARGLMDCDERFTSSFQLAVLHYQGAPDEDPTYAEPSYDLNRTGLTLNALNKRVGEFDSLNVAQIMAKNSSNFITKAEADFKFYLSYDFYAKDNPLFHDPNFYGFNQVTFGKIFTPQLNHITMKMPSVPAMLGKEKLEPTFCNQTSLQAQGINCKETFCECTHVLQVPLNSVVEMILVDEGVTYDANHMFHLHGNHFHVVGMDRLGKNVTIEEIKELDRLGRLKRRLSNSVRKDTVTVPDGGYTIIRFYADNPGIWLMHCHIDFHAEVGMAVIIKVGDYHQMAKPPIGFPTCDDFMGSEEEIIEKEEKEKSSGDRNKMMMGFVGIVFFSLVILIFNVHKRFFRM